MHNNWNETVTSADMIVKKCVLPEDGYDISKLKKLVILAINAGLSESEIEHTLDSFDASHLSRRVRLLMH